MLNFSYKLLAIHDCWCVNESGEEIEGSRVEFGEDIDGVEKFNCDKPTEAPFVPQGPCDKERQLINARNQAKSNYRSSFWSKPKLEFVPICTEDGFYQALQCDERGICWCLTSVGNEIPGTRVSTRSFFGTKPKPQCDNFSPQNGPCSQMKTQANFPTHLECDKTGYFEEVQCMTPTNCYCVDKTTGVCFYYLKRCAFWAALWLS